MDEVIKKFRLTKDYNTKRSVDAIKKIIFSFIRCGGTFKHTSFSHENESRVVWPIVEGGEIPIKFRKGMTTIIPYIDLSLENSMGKIHIDEIWVGPNQRKELKEDSVIRFLENQKNVTFGEIKYSDSSYRGPT